MGEMYDLANRMAMIAKEEHKSLVLVLRKDGTFQMTVADVIEEDRSADAETAFT